MTNGKTSKPPGLDETYPEEDVDRQSDDSAGRIGALQTEAGASVPKPHGSHHHQEVS